MDYKAIDRKILSVIDELRDAEHACTARRVARRLRMSDGIIKDRCQKMRTAGVVTWNPDMAGSLRINRTYYQELTRMLVRLGMSEEQAADVIKSTELVLDDDMLAALFAQPLPEADTAPATDLPQDDAGTAPVKPRKPRRKVTAAQKKAAAKKRAAAARAKVPEGPSTRPG